MAIKVSYYNFSFELFHVKEHGFFGLSKSKISINGGMNLSALREKD